MEFEFKNEIKEEHFGYDSLQEDLVLVSPRKKIFVGTWDLPKEKPSGKNLSSKDLKKSEVSSDFQKHDEASHSIHVNGDHVEKDTCLRTEVDLEKRRGRTRSHNIHRISGNKDPKKVFCKYCDISFNSNDELKNHLTTYCKRKFICSHCGYECNFKSNFNIHLLIHSNTKLFKCSECSYETNQRGTLNRHLLTHGKMLLFKRFKCSECEYECHQKGGLQRHMLKHGNLKILKCSHCSYTCNQKDCLNLHNLTHHKNVKLFKCFECGYECVQKGILNRHKLMHKEKLFKCGECSYECYRKYNLKRHMGRHQNKQGRKKI